MSAWNQRVVRYLNIQYTWTAFKGYKMWNTVVITNRNINEEYGKDKNKGCKIWDTLIINHKLCVCWIRYHRCHTVAKRLFFNFWNFENGIIGFPTMLFDWWLKRFFDIFKRFDSEFGRLKFLTYRLFSNSSNSVSF